MEERLVMTYSPITGVSYELKMVCVLIDFNSSELLKYAVRKQSYEIAAQIRDEMNLGLI